MHMVFQMNSITTGIGARWEIKAAASSGGYLRDKFVYRGRIVADAIADHAASSRVDGVGRGLVVATAAHRLRQHQAGGRLQEQPTIDRDEHSVSGHLAWGLSSAPTSHPAISNCRPVRRSGVAMQFLRHRSTNRNRRRRA